MYYGLFFLSNSFWNYERNIMTMGYHVWLNISSCTTKTEKAKEHHLFRCSSFKVTARPSILNQKLELIYFIFLICWLLNVRHLYIYLHLCINIRKSPLNSLKNIVSGLALNMYRNKEPNTIIINNEAWKFDQSSH